MEVDVKIPVTNSDSVHVQLWACPDWLEGCEHLLDGITATGVSIVGVLSIDYGDELEAMVKQHKDAGDNVEFKLQVRYTTQF